MIIAGRFGINGPFLPSSPPPRGSPFLSPKVRCTTICRRWSSSSPRREQLPESLSRVASFRVPLLPGCLALSDVGFGGRHRESLWVPGLVCRGGGAGGALEPGHAPCPPPLASLLHSLSTRRTVVGHECQDEVPSGRAGRRWAEARRHEELGDRRRGTRSESWLHLAAPPTVDPVRAWWARSPRTSFPKLGALT